MQNFLLSARAVLPMFLVIAVGYFCRRAGVLSREDVPRFNRVAFRVFLPCLLFYNVYVSDLSSAVRPRLIVFAVAGVLVVAALALAGVLRLEPRLDRRGVIAQGIFRSNYVIMGIPIAQALLGEGNLGPIAILIAIVVPLFNFLAVAVLESFRGGKVRPGTVLLEIAKNPLVVSSLLGILGLLLKIRLPSVVESAVSSLGAVATPLQLFLLGA
ncbi:MAG: AEC family transporter, partial [Oscillospiraceae bacterium]|nr:AEC family transporter [Oscillospiraceae bacterium]